MVDLPAGAAGELDFSTLLSVMHQQLQQEAPEEEILLALRTVDREQKGFVLAAELRTKLTTLGEKLTDQEGENAGNIYATGSPLTSDVSFRRKSAFLSFLTPGLLFLTLF